MARGGILQAPILIALSLLVAWIGSTAWFYLATPRPEMIREKHIRVIKLGRNVGPMAVLIWPSVFLEMLGYGGLLWIFREANLTKILEIAVVGCLIPVMLPLVYGLLRARVHVHDDRLEFIPMIGWRRILRWSEVTTARWIPFRQFLFLIGRDGTTVKVSFLADGFLEFLSDHLTQIEALPGGTMPKGWRQKVAAFQSARESSNR